MRLLRLRNDHFRILLMPAQRVGKGKRFLFLPMDHEDLVELAGHSMEITEQFVLVGMPGKGVDRGDFCVHVMGFGEDIDGAFA